MQFLDQDSPEQHFPLSPYSVSDFETDQRVPSRGADMLLADDSWPTFCELDYGIQSLKKLEETNMDEQFPKNPPSYEEAMQSRRQQSAYPLSPTYRPEVPPSCLQEQSNKLLDDIMECIGPQAVHAGKTICITLSIHQYCFSIERTYTTDAALRLWSKCGALRY